MLGMDREIYRRVKPALTVYAHRPGFNPHFAPREVLMALPGVGEQDVSSFTERRSDLRKQRDDDARQEVEEAPDEEAIFGIRKQDEVDEEFQSLEEEAAELNDETIKLLNALAEHPEITRFYTLGPSRGRYTIRAASYLVISTARSSSRPTILIIQNWSFRCGVLGCALRTWTP